MRERVVDLAVDHSALFNPSDLALFGFDLEKAAAMLEYLQRLAVGYLRNSFRNGGYTVAEIHLAGRDVDGFILLVAEAATAGGEQEQANSENRYRRPQRGQGNVETPN